MESVLINFKTASVIRLLQEIVTLNTTGPLLYINTVTFISELYPSFLYLYSSDVRLRAAEEAPEAAGV